MAAASDLPHAVCVELARAAVADGAQAYAEPAAVERALQFRRTLLSPVINATGVLLHTNLGRAPLAFAHPPQAINVEFDLSSGERGSRQKAVGGLLATLCAAEAAMVVNNGAAAVLLVLAALADGRQVLVSRGESVEIGGGFRVPDVMEQSGAQLVDVGTTNRTRLGDYSKALARKAADVALILKVHPSNYRIEGFVEDTPVAQLATLDVPVVADIGSGLIDANCPWLSGPPPAWLAGEPAARQSLAAGAALVTFSGDKLLVSGELVYVFADPSTQTSTPVPPVLRAMLEGFEAGNRRSAGRPRHGCGYPCRGSGSVRCPAAVTAVAAHRGFHLCTDFHQGFGSVPACNRVGATAGARSACTGFWRTTT